MLTSRLILLYRASPITDVALSTLANALGMFAVVLIIFYQWVQITAKRAAEAKLPAAPKPVEVL